ncbi:MAG: pyridoxal phosphate-dependent aminotransferase [Deltaproteobacteria bacterium]|jgi:(5-formylfuran-3-yl)methyl phosphate transaminase|nr:pyridoxal phosphate-dependent aminotransferase [Deltaproteobacteria bacterium]MBT4527684.1 pyridoxal phosphate-dependent aminotransferase [Deltaproteobacteria bacterium]
MKDINFDHLVNLQPFLAMEIFAKASELEKQGREIIHLEFGEPDFQTPAVISKAAIQAINDAQTKYTHTQGIDSFRAAVAKIYQEKYGVNISTSRILTSSGSSILLYIAIRLLVPPGDELLFTDPSYACYKNLAYIAGVVPKTVPLRLEDGFQLDMDLLKKSITPKTKAILINSPANPTGVVFSKETYKALAELEIPIISDEIYTDLIYEGDKYSMLNFTDRCVVLNGLSKYYAMTGWRLGYFIIDEKWVKTASFLNQNLMISASEFVQKAGAAALMESESECFKMSLEFDERRKFVLKRLKEIGLDPQYNPTAAFYIFLKYPNQNVKSLDLAKDILEKANVAMTPGIDFGQGGEGFIRLSYANSMENLDKALSNLEQYFKTYG